MLVHNFPKGGGRGGKGRAGGEEEVNEAKKGGPEGERQITELLK